MTARIGAGPVVRLGRPADLAEASGVYRRASLSNDGDRDNLLAHPEFLILGPEGLAEGRTQVAEQDGSVVGFATWNVTEVLIGLVRAIRPGAWAGSRTGRPRCPRPAPASAGPTCSPSAGKSVGNKVSQQSIGSINFHCPGLTICSGLSTLMGIRTKGHRASWGVNTAGRPLASALLAAMPDKAGTQALL